MVKLDSHPDLSVPEIIPFPFYHIVSQGTFCLLSTHWIIHPEIPEELTMLVVISDIYPFMLDTSSNRQVHHCPLIRSVSMMVNHLCRVTYLRGLATITQQASLPKTRCQSISFMMKHHM